MGKKIQSYPKERTSRINLFSASTYFPHVAYVDDMFSCVTGE